MSIPVLIMGESGTGKSTSMRNFAEGEIAVVNVQGKPLPFRGYFETVQSKNFKTIYKAAASAPYNAVVVDDFGYAITDYYVRHSLDVANADKDQFAVYKQVAAEVYAFFDGLAQHGDKDKIVYVMMHTEPDGFGGTQPLTVGKLLNEKIKIVGMVTVCLLSMYSGGRYLFKTNGMPPAKTPMGMFDAEDVDNDLKAVDEVIRDYWRLAPLTGEKGE